MCGLQRSELVVMASRPSIGKSSLALCIIHNVAVNEKKAVALFSLEMSKEQVAQNMLCARARVNAHQVRRGLLPEGESTKLAEAAGALYEADIIIDDSTSLTPLQLRAKARRMKAEHNIELVVVDYMQLMYVARSEGRQQEIAEISRSLKGLARELKVPVLAISQLNRAPEMRESHKPRLADLRESGAIEQDADVVLLLHRDDYYEEHSNPGRAELRIAKQRNGPVGSVTLTFLKEYMRFESYADEGL
jgi:replicative DNA helicase